MEQNKSYKSGIAALVGKTNVGKSTLLNSLIDEKVTIVSNRAQTMKFNKSNINYRAESNSF